MASVELFGPVRLGVVLLLSVRFIRRSGFVDWAFLLVASSVSKMWWASPPSQRPSGWEDKSFLVLLPKWSAHE